MYMYKNNMRVGVIPNIHYLKTGIIMKKDWDLSYFMKDHSEFLFSFGYATIFFFLDKNILIKVKISLSELLNLTLVSDRQF